MTKNRKYLYLALFLSFMSSMSAKADFVVCNDTQSRIGVALGYKDDIGWGSEGWWNIQPESCEPLINGELNSQYYFIHAIDYDKGGEWSGEYQLCVSSKSFTIRGNNICTESGWEAAGFLRVDTNDKNHWVIRLGDNQNAKNETSPEF